MREEGINFKQTNAFTKCGAPHCNLPIFHSRTVALSYASAA